MDTNLLLFCQYSDLPTLENYNLLEGFVPEYPLNLFKFGKMLIVHKITFIYFKSNGFKYDVLN